MGEHADVEAFSNELAALKRDGCNVLVVSDAAGRGPACERLLGAPELDRRHVFLSTSADVSTVLDRHSPRRTDPSTLGVVDATPEHGTRSAAAASAQPDSAFPGTVSPAHGAWYDRVDDFTDFEALLTATRDALDRVGGDAESPGEVRICVDSLDPFFQAVASGDAPEEGLFRFLHLLTSTVREADGMGHFHASVGADDDLLATFEPLFGATLYIDASGAGPTRQRWELHDSGRVTDWFEF